MADFGIGETIAAVADAGAKGAEAAGIGAGAADAAAITLPTIDVTAGALGAGELGAADAAAIGASAAGGIPDILVPAAASAGGFGVGDVLAGAGGLAAGLGSALIPSAGAGELTPNTIVSNEFGVVNQGIQNGDIQPTGGTMPNQFNAPTPTTAQGATTASAPAGVSPPAGADPTAALSGSPQALDQIAAGGTPSGGVSGGGVVPNVGAAPAANIGAPTGATVAQTTPSSPFDIGNLVKSAGESVAKNPLGVGLAGGGLIYSVMTADQISGAQKKLQEQAASLNAQGQGLMNYLTSGTLPPGLQASLDQATKAAKAKVISNYANQGLTTDPSKNSALAQQLAMIDQQAVISIAQMGQQLFQSGLSETGLSSSLYEQLVQLDQTQTANIGKAIASFAAAVSPSKGLTLNLGSGKAA